MTDLSFDLRGTASNHGDAIPRDHRYELARELERLMPWIKDDASFGIHAIQGAVTENDELLLNHRSRMVLRAAKSRVETLEGLSSQTIRLGNAQLTFGNMRLKPINLHTPLYAHCVTTGGDDEASFNQAVMAELDRLQIDARFICGRRQTIHLPEGNIYGFSLMLHGISIADAVRIQETGLGLHRLLGCGIFIPHKSIKALD